MRQIVILLLGAIILLHPVPGAEAGTNNFQKLIRIITEQANEWISREELEYREAKVNRDDSIIDDSCLPFEDFRLDVWPLDGAQVLYGETLLLRYGQMGAICQPVTVVIEEPETKKIVKQQQGKVGELTEVKASFQPGRKYIWYLKGEQGARSSHQSFVVLEEDLSKKIMESLGQIQKEVADVDPLLLKALYLQQISEGDDALDLFADSLRYINEFWKKGSDPIPGLYSYLMDNIWEYEN